MPRRDECHGFFVGEVFFMNVGGGVPDAPL